MIHKSGPNILVMEAVQADAQELSAFLIESFGSTKGRFLIEHGDWYHRGPGSRFVALCDGVIAGYRGMIPTVCLFRGRELPAAWAVDLFVSPQFRGKGLQRLLDQRVSEATELLLSFPTPVGARIYGRQGSGLRDDLWRLRVPLHPKSLSGILESPGSRGKVLRAGAAGLSPLAAVFRVQVARYRPRYTEIVESLDVGEAEDLFRKYATSDVATTVRSVEFLTWRYLDAPYRKELVFFATGLPGERTHCAIVRYRLAEGSLRAVVLDMFGDFDSETGVADLARTIVQDAVLRGATEVDALVGSPKLARAMRSAGFLVSRPVVFRWLADAPGVHTAFSSTPLHWTMGDWVA